jgi:hypothetical protein
VLQIRPSFFGPPAIAGGVSISTSKARNYRGSLAVEAEMGGGQEMEAVGAAGGGSSASHKHSNRLAQEHSPYLLQHAHNPVRKILSVLILRKNSGKTSGLYSILKKLVFLCQENLCLRIHKKLTCGL